MGSLKAASDALCHQLSPEEEAKKPKKTWTLSRKRCKL